MSTHPLSPWSCGVSMAATAALLYLGCAVLVALVPGSMVAIVGQVVHGLNLSLDASQIAPLRWGEVFIGTGIVSGYLGLTGALFATIYNRIGGR